MEKFKADHCLFIRLCKNIFAIILIPSLLFAQNDCEGHSQIDIYNHSHITEDMYSSEFIIVHNGASLTISPGTRVNFAHEKGIIIKRGAKLHVNGACLTKCDNAPSWRGIIAEGNAYDLPQPADPFIMPLPNQSSVVLVNNNAIIEWCRTAISTKSKTLPLDWAYYGALVHCEDAVFRNNKRAVEFLKYDENNNSKFINCVFDGSGNINDAYTHGVSIWDTDGVEFIRCRIENMENMGIISWDAGVIIEDGNQFIDNYKGIVNQSTYPFSSYLKISKGNKLAAMPNSFINNYFHIEANATAKQGGLYITQNEFGIANTAVYVNGPSRFLISDNSFYQSTGAIITAETGAFDNNQLNLIENNTFSNLSAITILGKNKELQVLCNQFSGAYDITLSDIDNNINYRGEIRAMQGTNSYAAGNCFTTPLIGADIVTYGNTETFSYYHTPESCHVPTGNGNYLTESTLLNYCNEFENINELTTEEHLLTGNHIALTSSVKDQFNVLNILIEHNEFETAQIYLAELNIQDPEIHLFKMIQTINLNRSVSLKNGIAYHITKEDQDFLQEIACSKLAVSSFAISLLSFFNNTITEPVHSIIRQKDQRSDTTEFYQPILNYYPKKQKEAEIQRDQYKIDTVYIQNSYNCSLNSDQTNKKDLQFYYNSCDSIIYSVNLTNNFETNGKNNFSIIPFCDPVKNLIQKISTE